MRQISIAMGMNQRYLSRFFSKPASALTLEQAFEILQAIGASPELFLRAVADRLSSSSATEDSGSSPAIARYRRSREESLERLADRLEKVEKALGLGSGIAPER